MKKLIIFPILFFFTFSFGQKKGIQGFKDADRYDKELVSKVNLELKGVPMVDTFKFNTSLLSLQIDLVADQKFITDTLPKFILDFYKKYKFPSEGKTNFVRIHLKSGGWIVFPEDMKKDPRIFLVMSPYYYFVIKGQMIWLYYNIDKTGNILGRNDGFRIKNFPVDVIKELIYNRKIISKESKN